MERKETTIVGCCLSNEELAAVDAVAKVLDPVKPKRAPAIRQLVRMGWKAWTNRDKS